MLMVIPVVPPTSEIGPSVTVVPPDDEAGIHLPYAQDLFETATEGMAGFVESRGQYGDAEVAFYSTGGQMRARFEDERAVFYVAGDGPLTPGTWFEMSLEGARAVTPVGVSPFPHETSFFIGNDPSRWCSEVQTYREILYEAPLDGVDLRFRFDGGMLKYDILLGPGIAPGEVVIEYGNIEGLEIDPLTGELLIETRAGIVRDMEPVLMQVPGVGIPGRFVLLGNGRVGVECLDALDPLLPTVIDPGLVYCTYLGGSGSDRMQTAKVDSRGRVIIVGSTISLDFPTTPTAIQDQLNTNASADFSDAFVTILNTNGTGIVASTYLGGDNVDHFSDLFIRPTGELVLTGFTKSGNFPRIGRPLSVDFIQGERDAILVKMASDLHDIIASSFFGGSGYDGLTAGAMADDGTMFMVGVTDSPNFPTTSGAYMEGRPSSNELFDIFVARINRSFGPHEDPVEYCTFLGGSGNDTIPQCDLDDDGSLYVAFWTNSTDLYTSPGALSQTFNGGPNDTYIVRLAPDFSDIEVATYFGGTGLDLSPEVLLDSSGRVYICGLTSSGDLPTTSNAEFPEPFPNTFRGDAFLTVFEHDLDDMVYSTYLGGQRGDLALDIVLSPDEAKLILLGETLSRDIDTPPGCYNDSKMGPELMTDLILYVFETSDWSIVYTTYFGGSLNDNCTLPANVLTMDGDGNLYFAFETESLDLPTTKGAYQDHHNGGAFDTAVVKMVPEACGKAPAPKIEVEWGHLWINLSWDQTTYERCSLKDVNIYRNDNDTRPLQPYQTVTPNMTYLRDTNNLSYNRTVYYWVSMTDTAGEGNLSGPIPVTIIGPPTGWVHLGAMSGDGEVHLNWTYVLDWSGGSENRFKLERWVDGGNVTVLADDLLPGNAPSYDDTTDLVLGETYHYRLTASNEEIGGSDGTADVLVYCPPEAPTIVSALAGDGFVNVTWEEPRFCGKVVYGYVIERRLSSEQTWTESGITGASEPYWNDTELNNGDTYIYRIRAFIEDLSGAWAETHEVKPYGGPSAPQDFEVVSSEGTITLNWRIPASNYDETTRYRIYWGTDRDHLDRVQPRNETDWIVEGHQLDTRYYFKVRAYNDRGEGEATETKEGYTLKKPSAPRDLMAELKDLYVRVSWTLPNYDGGNSSLTYQVWRGTKSGVYLQNLGTTTELYFEDWYMLEGGTRYYYVVKANNPVEEGPFCAEATLDFYSRPRAPTILAVSLKPSVNGIQITWKGPADDGGLEIKGYLVRRDLIGTGDYEEFKRGNKTTLFLDYNVTAYANYSYSIVAENDIGQGLRSEYFNITVTPHLTEPRNLHVVDNRGSILLRWDAPARQEFVKFRWYAVYRGLTESTMLPYDETNMTHYEDKDVREGRDYYYQVCFVGDVGQSDPSDTLVAKMSPEPSIPWYLVLALVLLALLGAAFVMWSRSRRVQPVAPAPAVEAASDEDAPWVEAPAAPTAAMSRAAIAEADTRAILTYIIEEVFAVYKDGRLITSCAREECGTQDADLMSGMLIAIQGLIQDGLQHGGKLESIKYGENLISVATGEHVVLAAVVYGRPDDKLQEDLRDTATKVEGAFTGVIEEWSGEPAALEGLDELLMPLIDSTAYLTRDDVGDVLAAHGVAMLSAVDFHRGYVRLKMAAVNSTLDTIMDAAVEVHYDGDMLRLERVEPAGIVMRGDRATLGNIKPGERKTVALLFDPQICQSTHIDGHLSYYDTKGELQYVEMKRRTADVVCPVFFTKENANTAMLRKLIRETLHMSDLRIYRYPGGLSPQDALTIGKLAVGSDDVQLVREYIVERPSFEAEVWYYAETRVKGWRFVIRLGVMEDKGVIELFAASTAMEPITGLLADFRRELDRILKERFAEEARIVVERDERLRRDMERRPLHLDRGDGD